MAGHNKWSKVKHIKARMDAKKGKAFTKVGRELTVAARLGGADQNMNAALRLAVQKARDVNMPKDTIQRAIDKGAGSDDGTQLEELTYEAYSPGGVGMLIRTLTDNKNRTLPNIKAILSKAGGSIAAPGSVAYLFDKKGVVLFDESVDSDTVIDVAVESGAEDVDVQDDKSIEVMISPESYEQLVSIFNEKGLKYLNASIEMVPQNKIELDVEKARKLMALIDKLDDDDDIQDVFHNADIPDEAMDEE